MLAYKQRVEHDQTRLDISSSITSHTQVLTGPTNRVVIGQAHAIQLQEAGDRDRNGKTTFQGRTMDNYIYLPKH